MANLKIKVKKEEVATYPCGSDVRYNGGESFPAVRQYRLGENKGEVSMRFEAYGVPDKFIVFLDDMEIFNTGYLGDASYQSALDKALTDLGLPTEKIIGGNGTMEFKFMKTSTVSSILRIEVYAPLKGTAWAIFSSCPRSIN
ncbi:hypothetical protein JZ968_06805 [Riemerella anatipestifer]|nr:hypothetical protein [Riemerella anatipestifer]